MDWTITLRKSLKTILFVLVGSVGAALVSPEVSAAATEATAGIPFVGGLVGSLAVAGIAALATALDNWRKNFNKPVPYRR